MNIVKRLRQAARTSGLSVYMVAKRAGMPVAIVQRWMAGGGLNTATAERIAAGLGYRITLEPIGKKAVKNGKH